MAVIFLSYARADGAEASDRLHGILENAKFTVWRDTEDIPGGADWKEEVREVLREMINVVLVLLTPEAIQSENVKWEWDTAISFKKKVIPVLIHDCEVPEELQRRNYRDLRQPGTEEYAVHLSKLFGDLHQIDAEAEDASNGEQQIAKLVITIECPHDRLQEIINAVSRTTGVSRREIVITYG